MNKQCKNSQEKHTTTAKDSILMLDNQAANFANNFKSSTKRFDICSIGTTSPETEDVSGFLLAETFAGIGFQKVR